MRAAWGSSSAPPFFGQIDFEPSLAEQIAASVRASVKRQPTRCRQTFEVAPYASVWTVFSFLAARYGDGGWEVYPHIGQALGLDLEPPYNRDIFKTAYRVACSRIGLRLLPSSLPTELFFPHLGVANAQSRHLASSLLQGALRFGPPPEEDISELRQWQRRATLDGLENHARVQAALENDSHAHYAQMFGAWRSGETAKNRAGRVFFQELDKEAAALGVRGDRLVAQPDILWTEYGLSLMARSSRVRQSILHGGLSHPLSASVPWSVPVPWPNELLWTAGQTRKLLRITPQPGEIFIFGLDTQKLAARLSRWTKEARVSARQVFLLAFEPFRILTERGAEASFAQGKTHIAIVDLGETPVRIETTDFQATIGLDFEPSIRMNAPVIGRCGAVPLHSSQGALEITSGAEVAETSRVLRLSFGERSWLKTEVNFDENGVARVAIGELGIPSADPDRLRVELLVKGTEDLPGARAEIVGRFYLWPDTSDYNPEAPFRVARVPGNFLANTSEHLVPLAGGLAMDPGRGFRHAVLSLRIENRAHDFAIPVRGTRLFHASLTQDKRNPVEIGSILVMGHAARHDSLIIRSTEQRADLYVRGLVIRRPFLARSQWEVTASQLALESPADDQVALLHDGGRRELLCRISQPIEPRRADLRLDPNRISVAMELPFACEAIGLEIYREGEDTPRLSAIALDTTPLEEAAPDWLTAEVRSFEPSVLELAVERQAWTQEVGLGFVVVQRSGSPAFERLEDSQGRAFAIPLAAVRPEPSRLHQSKLISTLAPLLATTFQPECDQYVRQVLGPRLTSAVATIAARRLYSPLIAPVFAKPLHGEASFLSRLDLLAPDRAPELFSADRAAFSTLASIPRARRLTSLAKAREPSLPAPRVDPNAAEHLGELTAWLERADALPDADPLSGGALRQAFRLFRQTAHASDFALCLEHETVGQTLKAVLNVYASSLERLLDHDEAAGTDRVGVRLAAYLSSFARAARAGRAGAFHVAVARRTGLPVGQVTPATSLAIQAATELFGYFMAFWTDADTTQSQELQGEAE